LRCRRPAVLALVCVALLTTPVSPAGADAKHPTQQEIDTARARVGTARHTVASLQVRAEAAAEAYNGAVARQHQAAVASAEANGRAVAARSQARQAMERVTVANQLSAMAAGRAATALEQQAAAVADVAAARQDLATFANAAYRTGGELTMAVHLMDARSPLELAQGHELMNSVSVFQQDAIDRMAAAQRVARHKADLAAQARVAAQTAVDQAAAALQSARDAAAVATVSSAAAALSAQQATAAVTDTVHAKATAQALVARAEDSLGSAKATVASLQQAAVVARREAEKIRAATLAAAQAAADKAAADQAAAQAAAAQAAAAAKARIPRTTSRSSHTSSPASNPPSNSASNPPSNSASNPPSNSPSNPPSNDTTSPVGRSAAQTAIYWAFQEVGVPYSWGGGDESGPTYGFAQGANIRGFDCSGLTLFAYGHAGIHLGHYTGSQYDQGMRISNFGDLQPGDLMYFATDTSNSATIHHMSIYIGGGNMIEAPHTGDVVKVSPARSSDFIGGTRPWA